MAHKRYKYLSDFITYHFSKEVTVKNLCKINSYSKYIWPTLTNVFKKEYLIKNQRK